MGAWRLRGTWALYRVTAEHSTLSSALTPLSPVLSGRDVQVVFAQPPRLHGYALCRVRAWMTITDFAALEAITG